MRPDGTRLKELAPIVRALPCTMPRRCDAQDRAGDSVDEDRPRIRRKPLPLGVVMDQWVNTGIGFPGFSPPLSGI